MSNKILSYLLMFLTLIGFSEKSYSQCCNTSQYPFSTILAPSSGATQVISSCSYLSEYSVVSSIVAGSSYTLDVASTNAWVTIYSGSSCGTFIASGASPLTFSAPSSGTYYIHWTVDALCATSTGCKTTTITEKSYQKPSKISRKLTKHTPKHPLKNQCVVRCVFSRKQLQQ